MPKLVDPAARRLAVVDAVFRVVLRDGLERASLRTVADEAGLNIGSVRHYFDSQRDLMCFAMQAMIDRVGARLLCRVADYDALGPVGPAQQRERAVGLLGELLPLDEQRRAEVTVFIDFVMAARTNPAFAGLADKAARGIRSLVRQTLTRLLEASGVRKDLDLDVETERLASLLDGLGLNAVLYPQLVGADACAAVLLAHLEGLKPA